MKPFNKLLDFYAPDNELLRSYIYKGFERLANGHLVTPIADRDKQALESSPHVSMAGETPFILSENGFYIQRYYQYESYVVEWIKNRLKSPADQKITQVATASFIQKANHLFERKNEGIDWQQIGALNCYLNPLAVLSGGPGTGKTTTVAKFLVLHLADYPTDRVALVAQTGKAAARLKESLSNQLPKLAALGVEADILETMSQIAPSTIHRLLKMDPSSLGTKFIYNEGRKLPHDVILIDEASMIDLPLMYKLLSALGEDTKVILMGDKNQLASVEAGSVFGDICDALHENSFSKEVHRALTLYGVEKDQLNERSENALIHLYKTYRFEEDSHIYRMGQELLSGVFKGELYLENLIKEEQGNGQVQFLSLEGKPDELPSELKTQLDYFQHYIAENEIEEALKKVNDVRVLCAHNNGLLGVSGMNAQVETYLQGKGLLQPSKGFYHNQPVMITRNDYQLKLYNGDVGIVRKNSDGELLFYISDAIEGYREIAVHAIKDWRTVFAMTIHKSQGSEFQQVVMVVPASEESKILTRELIYTGLTRATTQVLIYGDDQILQEAAQKVAERASGIKRRLTND